MDEADVTQERMEAEEARRRKAMKPVEIPKGEGACLNCGEPIKGEARWCDVACRNDWLQRNPQHK